ncbi:chromosome segregation protein SMC [Dyella caseinilytica]|uniref:Chromosome partition protein Smc n=1 Tax=Dyella caseinilytica TaxID=1849581 RepID=A0ABX7GXC6_9GAMM|nr:chromosome segregation protein SMC [Dyella caseinilytica]QRN55116.1 chromosome segregation protein SMC [Dyella caseinilytica]GFZ99470.1 chromosome partition protein Smc [Dyella caseinilytica]
MRLTTIKLAGFKSFVDPTTLHLPTNMTGVVGPNGCGKSNIIDAIRWVMGESAASRLRGDSITDVIFSGSNARKPVGQATVELIFDNSDGTIQGEYAQYAEISVKRQVTRDGQSAYFLNGARCRRRDITDLFLGTGLGPRSYSIIEQGMISQIIEAHPEELRTHLEEAAGISKYKERRKETESRIKATRENLDRVRDVRDEVDKQLEHLNRQARAAERWKGYKEEQTRKEAELRALEYRGLKSQHEGQGQGLSAAEIDIEKRLATQRQIESQIESARERHTETSEHLNTVQAEVYKVGAEIARVEQQVRYNRETADRLQRAQADAEREHGELAAHIATDREQIETLRLALSEGEPKLESLQQMQDETAESQRETETKLADWQQRWDTYTRTAGEASRAAEVERTKLAYLDRQSMDLGKRKETLENEQKATDVAALDAAAEQLHNEHDMQRERVESLGGVLDQHKLSYEKVLDEERQVQSVLNEARQQLQTARGRLASLEALQHAALGQEESASSTWLAQFGLDKKRRLGEVLQVEAGWETAVETVLSGFIDSVLVDGAHDLARELHALKDADVALLDAAEGGVATAGTLAAHVRGPASAMAILGHVLIAETIEEAHQRVSGLSALAPYQSVITRSGEWLGPGWARVRRAQGNQVGVLAREREIRVLTEQTESLQAQIEEASARLDILRTSKFETERARDDAQRELYNTHRRQSELAGQLQSHRGKVETARARSEKVAGEISALIEQMEELQGQTRDARARLDESVNNMGDLEDQRRELENERRALLEAREEARMNAREAADQAHALALSMESKRSSLTSLEQALGRMDSQIRVIEARRTEIAEQLEAGSDPIAELEAERQTYLDQRLLVDRQLVEARRAMEDCDIEVRKLEQQRHSVEQELSGLREKISEQKLAAQALQMRADQLAEAITASGLDLETLLAELAEDVDATQWRQQLADLAQKIARLEPVNLAAIQEHAEQSERKTYLDNQLNDLTSAMETLENAIKKIDRETRQRFKETFDRVNAGVQELFPRLFGGGHAYLELTGDDLLSTGVSIMARPPGKRVSNITLLSGGEKALTAVSLVFAIFALNPAPFCLLDEVDAPLDEANVGRFSNMVREMSEKVQFIFVSHNKATMEAASQLCGVTMREPGVSRLVQVDLAEAAKLAGAA